VVLLLRRRDKLYASIVGAIGNASIFPMETRLFPSENARTHRPRDRFSPLAVPRITYFLFAIPSSSFSIFTSYGSGLASASAMS
jgi:hypothetical protein